MIMNLAKIIINLSFEMIFKIFLKIRFKLEIKALTAFIKITYLKF